MTDEHPDVFEDFAAETARLDQLLGRLTDQQWASPSACPGWSIADVVVHLAMSEEAVVAAFDQGDSGMSVSAPSVTPVAKEGDGAVDAIMEALVRTGASDEEQAALWECIEGATWSE